jgi:N-acetylglucosamine-6-sulfatase
LKDSGYESGYVGKWHMGVDDTRRPGFDYWVSVKGQGEYFDPEINDNGRAVKQRGYVTDIFNQRAVEFAARKRNRPFVLYVAHKAVHPNVVQHADGSVTPIGGGGFTPAPRHARLYAGVAVKRRPNAGRPPAGKPALERRIGNLPPLGPATGTDDETIRNRLRLLAAIDEGVGQLLDTLQKIGQLDNTLFVFTSDNGYFYGEHGLSQERRLAYEESIRIPMLVRYPASIKAGTIIDSFALNIDIGPTLLEYASAPARRDMHGRSLRPLLEGRKTAWRDSFLIEYFSDRVMPRIRNMGYEAVRGERWKYIHYTELDGMDELYDLERDPYELRNVISNQAARDALRTMQRELAGHKEKLSAFSPQLSAKPV